MTEEQREKWNKFVSENNMYSFLQAWEWGEFQRAAGKKIYRINVGKRKDPDATALILRHSFPLGRNYLYCPRGPVVKKTIKGSAKKEVLRVVFGRIAEIAKKEKSLFLRFDPPVECNKNDLSDIKDNVVSFLSDVCTNRSSSKFNFQKSPSEIQPQDTLVLDLSETEERLLSGMKQKTRYNIRLAERKGVRVISTADYERYFSDFWNLMKETSRRNKIVSHSESYYYRMLKTLCPGAVFLEERGVSLGRKKRLCARLYLAEYKKKIIAANIVLFFGDLAVYLHGASSNEHRNVMATYLLQWRQIMDAKDVGCMRYDFWGITIGGGKKNWAGITRFKKGFGGDEVRYIGAYDLVFDSLGYNVYNKLASTYRRILTHIRAL